MISRMTRPEKCWKLVSDFTEEVLEIKEKKREKYDEYLRSNQRNQ